MLQQTQVATVIPYFERFITAFPTIEALAAADEQSVLRQWEGLGYYRRARFLHRAARVVMAQHGGAFPTDPKVVAKLPGFGRYTVGAVLSQAFDQRLPILEANSLRLLSRLVGVEGDLRSSTTQRLLWQAAEELLPRKQVGDFNQALMEVGALVCTPTDPLCHECPLVRDCFAYREQRQHEIPGRAQRPQLKEVSEVAVVVRRHEKVFLVQRGETGRWPNMWEFPHAEVADTCADEEAALSIVAELTGLQAERPLPLLTLRHGVTRFRITLACFEATLVGGSFSSQAYRTGRWLAVDDLADFPVSSPQRRLAKFLARDRQPRLF